MDKYSLYTMAVWSLVVELSRGAEPWILAVVTVHFLLLVFSTATRTVE